MKHWTPWAAVLLLLTAALIWSEVTKPRAPVGPQPILNLIADSERELTRLPVAFTPLPDAEEISIGKQLEQVYVSQLEPNQDRAIEQYVQRVGALEATHAHRKLPYRFHYVPGLDFVNAFALPGGAVFIGGGLMSLMDTEDELAAVLGHELEHIDHYHCAERIQIEAALHRTPAGEWVAFPVEVFVAGYSKSQELEADREGAKLAAASGYSPLGAIQMFQAFERFDPEKNARAGTPQEELSGIAQQALEGYFRSHPSNPERIDQIQQLIADDQLPNHQSTKPLQVAYVFLTERAWRSVQAAQARPVLFLSGKEKREWEAERVKQYNQAVELASQSLALVPDQPRATEIVGVAKLGLGDFAATAAIYRELLPRYPAFADDLRLQVDAQAQQALEAQRYDRAISLTRISLELQPNQREASKILAEAQLCSADFRGAAETGRKLQRMYPDTADELRAYADEVAASRFGQKRYQEAAGLAAESLDLKPDQKGALLILAMAQFALADFSSASSSYRKLLDPDAPDIELVRSYADALSADLKPDTGRTFQVWMAGVKPPSAAVAMQIRVELAGLNLLSGDETLAKSILAQARSDRSDIAPELLGRVAWWYYRAGKYEACAAVLRDGIAQRPGDPGLQVTQAWNGIQQHQLDDSIRLFTAASADPEWNSPMMGRAVANWQAHHTQDALNEFNAAAKELPEWRNPRWVQAFYSASVAQSVAEIGAESSKRQTAKR